VECHIRTHAKKIGRPKGPNFTKPRGQKQLVWKAGQSEPMYKLDTVVRMYYWNHPYPEQ
jgi:hypothetical protein